MKRAAESALVAGDAQLQPGGALVLARPISQHESPQPRSREGGEMKTLVLCWLLVCIPFECAQAASPPAESLRSRTLSDQDMASIRAIAWNYPCSMLTLLYLMRE